MPTTERTTETTTSVLPSPLTSFIGRAAERIALHAAVVANREVTALGPGGVGKTRLALAVAAEVAGEFADGVWFVDLVPVTDAEMTGAAVARALGLGEQQGRSLDDSVLTALADREMLLVLDNCEHVREGVAPFVERLLVRCPHVTVLVTSRARLMVPFEQVYVVPPLSVGEPAVPAAGGSDAVTLFLDRASALGWPVGPEQLDRVTEICRRLDGSALAIELAAARLPALGLDGLTASLADPLRLLVGGRRADDRHRSMRAMLDWSQALLAEPDRCLLRRVAVFVAPFTVADAVRVAGYEPLAPAAVADGLARLTEQSLLSAVLSATGTRYRVLTTIRQYETERLDEAGELTEVLARHLQWCTEMGAVLARADTTGAWRAGFDAVADDMRAALGWAEKHSAHRQSAYELALSLAELAFARNLVGESQRRWEQAAALAADPAAAGSALRASAAAAGCRMDGADMFRLYRAAAEVAREAGDAAAAATDLATAAITVYRMSETFAESPPTAAAALSLSQARELAGGDAAAEAAVALAECGVPADTGAAGGAEPGSSVAATLRRAERAVELAARTGDRLVESAALDALAAAQLWAGGTFAAAATTRQRVESLAGVPVSPGSALEWVSALAEAADSCLGVGDLVGARRWGEHLRGLPLLAERGDFATSRLLVADALAGRVEGVLAAAGRFFDAWTLSGRGHAPALAPAAAAVAMVHGLRGDGPARAEWLAVATDLGVTREQQAAYRAVFDAVVLLHEGRAGAALARLAAEPDEMDQRVVWVWRHWYFALRAEAAVLAGDPSARGHLVTARTVVAGDPVAGAIVDRAAAVAEGGTELLPAVAAVFEAAGCGYQRARTLFLAGGSSAAAGAAQWVELGCTVPGGR
ncbi:ATPase [Nocardia sp. NPDC004568]|uniref:ATP-binding protein n=1 Tax=Nocardia sp. NPDC004568 TaxID=3154551 RepID=UPI0033A15523